MKVIPHLCCCLSSSRDLGRKLNALADAVDLAAVDLLARLLDGLEDGLVVELGLGNDGGLLLLEGDVVGLDACVGAKDAR